MTATRVVIGCALATILAGCATRPAIEFRALVYNIHAGKDAAGVDNLERVAALIASTGADIVLLQEIDRGTTRSRGADHLAELARLTGFHAAFGKSLDYQGGEYGIAILSRWPLSSSEVVPLRVDPPQTRAGGSKEPRVALLATAASPFGAIRILNTHLDASREESWRMQEVTSLLGLASAKHEAFVLGGDFNSEPGSAAQSLLRTAPVRDAWEECGSGASLTFPAAQPVKRIDYLFLTGRLRCSSARVVESDASDHRPLLVVVTR